MNSAEIWKDIEGFEGLYQVSNMGRVRSLDREDALGRRLKGKVLAGRPSKGYLGVALYRDGHAKGYPVHRLIAKAFLDNPSNLPEVNHKDENKANNAVSNLEWCTSRYNCNYGTRNERVGKASGKSIYVVMNSGHRYFFRSATKAAELLGLNTQAICNCIHGRCKHHRGFSFERAV
ncbi:HNH endonuclease [Lactobacillus phage LJ]|uniref:Endonuclease n=1 Tax=Lactobacillus phage LJ TaxID=2041454 RepID=A0A2D1GPF4_9CAUD|nr:HNH endonuclease [Lactobacillus phage LJ]ATN93890.1 endonuclease [Lactobacillus phage LJ]